jgi:hypothetical protein
MDQSIEDEGKLGHGFTSADELEKIKGLNWMGVPRLMGPGFFPKLTFDLLDDFSYLAMLVEHLEA